MTYKAGRGRGAFAVGDGTGNPAHEITWWALPHGAKPISVQVGSCPQWHGFSGSTLTLALEGGGSIGSVTLSR